MATSKTASFWLTETVALDTPDAIVQGTIDLGAYVDVGDQQSVSVESVDYIVQIRDTATGNISNSLGGALTGNAALGYQVSDLNPNSLFLRADDTSLVSSGSMYFDDINSIASVAPDFYPDNYGKLDETRMIVNDSLYFTANFNSTPLAANREILVTARIKARIVKLSTKDWMAIAVQSVASDN